MYSKTHTAIEALHAVTHAAALAGLALTPVWGQLASWGYLAAGMALFALVAVLSAPVAWGMGTGYAHHVATRRRENALRDDLAALERGRVDLAKCAANERTHRMLLHERCDTLAERVAELEAWARTTQRTVDAARSERNTMREGVMLANRRRGF